MDEKRKQTAVTIMREKAEILGRKPTRATFTASELCLIKSVFGPLPRALEAAGVKKQSKQFALKQVRRKQKQMIKADTENKNA